MSVRNSPESSSTKNVKVFTKLSSSKNVTIRSLSLISIALPPKSSRVDSPPDYPLNSLAKNTSIFFLARVSAVYDKFGFFAIHSSFDVK